MHVTPWAKQTLHSICLVYTRYNFNFLLFSAELTNHLSWPDWTGDILWLLKLLDTAYLLLMVCLFVCGFLICQSKDCTRISSKIPIKWFFVALWVQPTATIIQTTSITEIMSRATWSITRVPAQHKVLPPSTRQHKMKEWDKWGS